MIITTPEIDPTTAAVTLGPDCCATVVVVVGFGTAASLVVPVMVVSSFLSVHRVKASILQYQFHCKIALHSSCI